jgi:hypothetical protein
VLLERNDGEDTSNQVHVPDGSVGAHEAIPKDVGADDTEPRGLIPQDLSSFRGHHHTNKYCELGTPASKPGNCSGRPNRRTLLARLDNLGEGLEKGKIN